MKLAVFHNFMDNIGGAEIVCLTLAKELGADVYTTNIDEEKIEKMGFSGVTLNSIGKIPINTPFRQQAALARFRRLNLKREYDFYIIGGDWAVSAAVNNKPNLWYVHSPIREIWDLYEDIRRNAVPWFKRWAYDAWVRVNRNLNTRYVDAVDMLACNSFNTRNRVKKYLNRDATVVYPPTDTAKFHYNKSGDFWLSVNRLFWHKRVDIQIEAFRQLPNERLIIVGSYEQSKHFRQHAEYIKKIKPANVEIISWVDCNTLRELYADCKGFIATALDEDFGMTPVEAMASGKPVIAPNDGGYRETVVNGVTGRLIDDIDSKKLILAIDEIGKDPEKYKQACLKAAQKLDVSVFIKGIRSIIQEYQA
jgi:glycosyltransferase involved in cell wall biosynthesis